MSAYKVIVAHPGKQHSYQLATALNAGGMLFKYITTVYDKENALLLKFARLFLNAENQKRSRTRRCAALDDSQVVQFCRLRALITLLLVRVDKSKKLYNAWNQHVANVFSVKVAKYAIKHDADAVVLYDSSAEKGFAYLAKKAPRIKRILDASCANRLYMKEIYEQDMVRSPAWAATLKAEKRVLWEMPLERYIREAKLADAILAASSFVKTSYTAHGIDARRVHVLPYGVDLSMFKPVDKMPHDGIRFLYVGGVRQMKGIAYLLQAFAQVHAQYPQAQLEVIGDCVIDEELIEPYKGFVTFSGYMLSGDVVKRYQEADVFVFPSLADGYGLVGLEAMASGLAMIVSDHSGIADAVTEDIGYVYSTWDVDELFSKMQSFCAQPDTVVAMRETASERAQQYTWDAYYTRAQEIIAGICDE